MKKIALSLFSALLLLFSVGLTPISAAVKDGSYSIPYQVNQPQSNSASIANDYFVKPAKVTVKGGIATVQITLKNSAWITKFQPPGGATVISEDKAADTRTVQFTVNDMTKPIMITMKVDVEDINYHHEYSVGMVLDTSSIGDASATPAAPTGTDGGASATDEGAEQGAGTPADQEKNPQTSDSTPYILFGLLAVSAVLLMKTKFQPKQEA